MRDAVLAAGPQRAGGFEPLPRAAARAPLARGGVATGARLHRRLRVLFGLAVVLLGLRILPADVVILRSGGQVEGEITDLGDRVEVKTRHATVTFAKRDILEIQKRKLPRDIYAEELSRLKHDDAEGHFQLALYCKEHELLEEYGELLQKVLLIRPDHPQARAHAYNYKKIYQALPVDEASESQLLTGYGTGFRLTRSEHYVLAHSTDLGFAQTRLVFFERLYRTFYQFFEDRGFTLRLLDRRLEGVVFASQDEFQAVARRVAPSLEQSGGFYAPSMNRLFFFDNRNSDNAKNLRERLRRQEGLVADLRERVKKAKKAADRAKFLEQFETELTRFNRLKREGRAAFDELNLAVTIHEATHQLCYNSGLLVHSPNNPTWLVEGLATFFEDPDQWTNEHGQLGKVNDTYLAVLRESFENDRHIGLGSLAPLSTNFFTFGDDVDLAYSQAWSMVHFLLLGANGRYAPKFYDYLRKLHDVPVREKISDQRRVGDLVGSLGIDTSRLDEEWTAYVKDLLKRNPPKR
ncbi:MAG: DUF1570 domain-containing protein [Planctomycetes bacterium]|nr:DUF1570 domain-containing protein [Planctomycetota bacterium]